MKKNEFWCVKAQDGTIYSNTLKLNEHDLKMEFKILMSESIVKVRITEIKKKK